MWHGSTASAQMEIKLKSLTLAMSVAVAAAPANAAVQQNTMPAVSNTHNYADLADLALAASITAHVRIRSDKRLSAELATGVRPGFARHLVTADVIALVKANDGVQQRVRFLVDLPTDSRGKSKKLKNSESLVFAQGAGIGTLRLIAPDAQIPWTAAAASDVRAILSEAAKADAPPLVRGVASAFHSEGSIPGEGETQVFLNSSDNKPVSLTVQRQAGGSARWFVSQGEVVDEGTSQPRPNTLLWYRIACTLPSELPTAATEGQSPEAVAQITMDYRLVLDQLGRCVRIRKSGRGA